VACKILELTYIYGFNHVARGIKKLVLDITYNIE